MMVLGSGGISCFIVEKDSQGLSFGAKEEKVLTLYWCSGSLGKLVCIY